MKFTYNLDKIVSALAYNDLKGLLKLMDNKVFINGEPSVSEMEELFKKNFQEIDNIEDYKEIEGLMLSCARVNSIGY